MPRRQPATRTSRCNNSASSSNTAFSSLPPEVRDALRQLPSATARLAEGAADDTASPFARLSCAERCTVDQLLTSLEGLDNLDGFSAETAAALLSKRPVQLPLLHLALAALRVTPGECEEGETRDCGGVQVRAFSLIHVVLHQATDEGSPRQRLAAAAFIRALLRAQALQAASRQLAALVEALLAVSAAVPGTHQAEGQGQEQQDGEQQQQQQGRESGKDTVFVENVITSLTSVALFVYDLVHWAAVFEDALCMELAAALHDSGVLEHAARALLLVLLLPLVGRSSGLGDVYTQGIASALTMSSVAHADAAGPILGRLLSSALPGAAAAASQLRAALSGRCVQTAGLSVGVATLCAADGGTAYGLPPELFAALPVKARVGAGRPWQGGLPQVGTPALEAALHLLALESRAQPPGRRGALSLALRAGRLGVASAVAAAAGADAPAAGRGGSAGDNGVGSNSSGSGGGSHLQQQLQEGCAPPRMVVAANASAPLCCTALMVSALLLQRAHPESVHWRADAEEWCRLVVAAVRYTLRYAREEEEQRQLCAFLAWAADEEVWTEEGQPLRLSPEPPVVIAAALGGGLLPCLERLMRRAGQAPQGPEAAVLRRLLGTDDNVPWRYLAPLLAYGDPRQAAALMATLSKLLRAIHPSAALAAACEPDCDTQHLVVWVTGKALLGIFALTSGLASQPQEGGPAPVHQLARLMSLAACEWLPALSRLALTAMQAAPKRGKVQWVFSEVPRLSLAALLLWLPLLARRCTAQGSAPPAAEAAGGVRAATGAPGPAAGGAPEGAGRASWRSLVLEELGAVQLLGTALELAAAVAAVDKWQGEEHPLLETCVLRLLVESCCAVAYMLAMPGECLWAALAAAAGVPDSRSAAAATGEPSSGAGQGPADSGGEAPIALPWRPEHLRAVAARLRANGGEEAGAAAAAESLADELEGRREGDDVGAGAGSAVAATDRLWRPGVSFFFIDALLPPSDARRLLRTCGNPGCTNVAGDSEAELPLQACSRCGAVGYCCRACQVAHWRAGHGAACKGREKR